MSTTHDQPSIRTTSNALFKLMCMDPLPAVDTIDMQVRQINMAALTPQEREWANEQENSDAK